MTATLYESILHIVYCWQKVSLTYVVLNSEVGRMNDLVGPMPKAKRKGIVGVWRNAT